MAMANRRNRSRYNRWTMRHLLSRLRSYFILDPLIFLYTAVLGAGSLMSAPLDRSGRIQHGFARVWSWLILKTCLAPVEVIGAERLRAVPVCVVAANHLSAMDIPVLYSYLPFPFRIVAKKELFIYPFVGWHLKWSGQIPIDSSSPRATFKSLLTGVNDLAKGLSVVIFPEGQRSSDGNLQAFQNGAFYLAIKAQAPVVPVTIVGTFEMLPMNTYHIKPRRLKLVIGEPIMTTGLTTHQIELVSERTRRAIAEMYDRHRGGQHAESAGNIG
jgi:1-acyl-sn-glycerol-3-phosphate acyltransferase